MAQKQKLRPSPLDEPPTASSSDSEEEEEQQQQQPSSQQHEEEEEEVSSGEEEEASSEEEEDENLPPPPISKNPPPPPPSNPQPQPTSSESETESGSETESEPHPTPVKVKPLASKPMDQAQKPKAQPSPAPPPPKSASKRPAENNNNNARVADPKRAKKKATESSSAAAISDDEMEEDGKKSGDNSKKFQRLWSEEDELAILKGVVEFTSKTGLDPLKFPNANAFHDFMKKSLHVEFSSNQLKEKLRRLKKKFETQAGKGKNGDAPKFSKPHDQKFFELSKKAWGSEDGGVANGSVEKPKSNGNAAKSPNPKKKESGSRNVASAKKPKPETNPEPAPVPSLEFKESERMEIDQKPDGGDACLFLRELVRYKEGANVSRLDEDDVKRGLELIEESKRAELRGKWKKLHHAEMELFANRSELIGEQTKLILEALRSSNH
ncbi:hypothetical protein AAZX31_15G061200 [Glycine max]|uniref:Glabrous enhancer-binding protein-like DBD domain-containing protein n=1 Tax=Glycine max TaxID=3847 RepID=K7M9X4_SOYBN|nr:STOREKEEPER protein [Glycine max]KAG4381026.1 hypothetical protein GLYMA_15G063300v4 [Glycine max]KAG4381027.1 hypothetical protein GLYMA_15G063300v4 [Glycine max]KAG4381028.1 hypothetical protein GLYMA_15G063300v4 [Glycine max]KAG4948363.1 hypothetical protein JHK86_041602 [Glycine max]KAG4955831.1 hypothetical protein JHK85_042211 [Glycine max]|eukprot:XP_003547113.1 STOREKEEPER protein [Glycine max]